MTGPQHDHHLIPWVKATFGITVEPCEDWYGPREFIAYRGDWDLDIPNTTGGRVFHAALEYVMCYGDQATADRVVEIEMGRAL